MEILAIGAKLGYTGECSKTVWEFTIIDFEPKIQFANLDHFENLVIFLLSTK